MKEAMKIDASHELHGMDIWNPDDFEYSAKNVIVKADGGVVSVGWGKATGDVDVFYGKSADEMLAMVEERGYELVESEAFIDQPHELKAAVERGAF